MSTPTPRTDMATYPADCLGTTLVTNRDCSRALETELVAITAERDQLRAEVERLNALGSWAHTCTHHNDEQRAKAKGCPVCATTERDAANARAERAEADLDQVACARTDGILRESDLTCTLNMERKQFNKVKTALKDAISTYFGDDKLVTTERIEAWQAALKEDSK